MSRTQHSKDMSLCENRESREGKTLRSDRKQTYRLYPSLPREDRYEVCLPTGSSNEKAHEAAIYNPNSRLEDSKSDAATIDRLKTQVLRLEEQREQLLSINKEWATQYQAMKCYYREKFKKMKALLQKEEIAEEENYIKLHERIRESSSTREEDTTVSSDLLKARNKELQVQNDTLTNIKQCQQEEIARLKRAFQDSFKTATTLEMSNETLSDVWKQQAEIYKEDFMKERRDREKLKKKYLELEERFRRKTMHNPSQDTKAGPPQRVFKCTGKN